MSEPRMFYDVVIDPRDPATCTVNGVALRRMPDETSRIIFTDDRSIVVKVDRSTPQAQREAETWLKLTPEDRQYFATLLQVGPDYVVEELVPLNKRPLGDREAITDLARDLFVKYDFDWDWQGWAQFGVDRRTGTLCIHDYPAEPHRTGEHCWTTLQVREAA